MSLTVHHQPLAEHKQNRLVLCCNRRHFPQQHFGRLSALQLEQLNVPGDKLWIHLDTLFQHPTGLIRPIRPLVQLAQVEVCVPGKAMPIIDLSLVKPWQP